MFGASTDAVQANILCIYIMQWVRHCKITRISRTHAVLCAPVSPCMSDFRVDRLAQGKGYSVCCYLKEIRPTGVALAPRCSIAIRRATPFADSYTVWTTALVQVFMFLDAGVTPATTNAVPRVRVDSGQEHASKPTDSLRKRSMIASVTSSSLPPW